MAKPWERYSNGAVAAKPWETAPAQPEPPKSNALGDLLRQFGLSLRAPVEGLGDAADFVATPMRAAINLPFQMAGQEPPVQGRTGEAVANLLQLPKPENDTERLAGKVASAGFSAMIPAGAAQRAAKATSGATQQLLKFLGESPAAQTLLTSLGGGASELTRQAHGTEGEQMAAGIVAPMATALAANPVSRGTQLLKNIATAPTDAGARRAAGRIAVDVAGDQTGAIAQALRDGLPPETAAAAAVPVGRAEFAGLERTVASRAPSAFGPNGSIELGRKGWMQGQKDFLNQVATPIREKILQAADQTGLDVAPLSMEVAQRRALPGSRDTTTSHILSWMDNELVRRSDSGTANISATDLYDLRRDLGDYIKKMSKNPDINWDKAKGSAVLRDMQRSIDWEIERASGMDWQGDYLRPYAQRAAEIDSVGDRAKIAARSGAFGAQEARRISKLDESPITLPNLLSRPMMISNAVLRTLQGRGGEKTSRTLADLMQPQNKEVLARLMEEELASRNRMPQISQRALRALLAGTMESARVTNQ